MRNKYFCYTSSRIMTQTFLMYKRNVYYYTLSCIMTNKYCHYTSSRITRYTLSCIREMFVVII